MNIFRQMLVKPWLTDQEAALDLQDERTFSLPTPMLGLRVFLIVVMVFFTLMISAFTERRLFSDWHSTPVPWLLWVNTGILVLSSIAMHRAWTNARRDRMDGLKLWLSVGGILTLAFLLGQLLAWRELMTLGHFASTDPANAFFYMLTAVHGVHLVGGLVAWSRTTAKIRRGTKQDEVRLSVELCTVYWHFLLLIWMILFALLLLT
jgi:cytochrome c oxidase subunit 3